MGICESTDDTSKKKNNLNDKINSSKAINDSSTKASEKSTAMITR